MTDHPLVALTTIAPELDTTVAALATQLGDDVLLDDVGRRCCERHIARRLLDDHRAAKNALARRERQRLQAERARRNDSAAIRRAERAARQARADHQRQILDGNSDMTALEVMRLSPGDDGGLGQAGHRLGTLLAQENLRDGQSTLAGYSFGPPRSRKDQTND